jgi:hypothetical protein
VQSIRRRLAVAEEMPFQGILDGERIGRIVGEELGPLRRCVYTPLITLWTFLSQVLSADQSCRGAVARLMAYLVGRGRKPCSAKTGPYCKARKRLPESVVARLVRELGGDLHQQSCRDWLLAGRSIKLVDGSTVSMPDTEANQEAYPQQRAQKPGLGFPIARIVGVLSLACGTVLDLAVGPYRGKETGENALFRRLWWQFQRGDVVVGDCQFGSFWNFSMLAARGVDCVFPLHQMRQSDFRLGRRLGKEDHVVVWCKPSQRPDWMDEATYDALPQEMALRELRIHVRQAGFRTKSFVVVTTLLDAEEVSKEELASVYRARWHAELDLRSIKVTMQMDVLRTKTPDMVRKEIWMHLLAYNLIRTVMAQAALAHGVLPREVSFAGALQTFNAFREVLQTSRAGEVPRIYQSMLAAIATHRVGDRPDRVEPRAIKRRPKPHRLLTVPRHEARRQLLQGTYD